MAGKTKGLAGKRSGLFYEVIRILEEQEEDNRPEWIIFENVKNLLGINDGWDMFTVLSEMDRVGYDCEWQVFNSAVYVPQNRERIYFVCHLRKYGTRKIFPVEETDGQIEIPRIKIIAHRDGYRRNTQTFDMNGITETLSTCQGGGREHHVAIPLDMIPNDYSVCAHQDFAIRKITPKESFRLQGFPDEMYERAAFVNSDSQLFKQAGNSVTIPVVYEIAKRLDKITRKCYSEDAAGKPSPNKIYKED